MKRSGSPSSESRSEGSSSDTTSSSSSSSSNSDNSSLSDSSDSDVPDDVALDDTPHAYDWKVFDLPSEAGHRVWKRAPKWANDWFDDYVGPNSCDGTGGCHELINQSHFWADCEIHNYLGHDKLYFLMSVRRGELDNTKLAVAANYSGDYFSFDEPHAPAGFVKRRGLSLAAIGGHLDIAEYLLTDVKVPLFRLHYDRHDNAMFIAIHKGNLDFVKLLIRYGWSPQVEGDKLCNNSIEHAAKCGQLNILRYLLEGKMHEPFDDDNASKQGCGEWKGMGLWAVGLLPDQSGMLPSGRHLRNRAKLLYSAMCCPNNELVIDYLVHDVGILTSQIQYSLHEDYPEHVLYQGYIVGLASKLDIDSYAYAYRINPSQMCFEVRCNEILKLAQQKKEEANSPNCLSERSKFKLTSDESLLRCSSVNVEKVDDGDDESFPDDDEPKDNCDSIASSKSNGEEEEEEEEVDEDDSTKALDSALYDRSSSKPYWNNLEYNAVVCKNDDCDPFHDRKDEYELVDASHPTQKFKLGYVAFQRAVHFGDLDTVMDMWEHQKYVNATNVDTPPGERRRRLLPLAIAGSHLKVAEYLITVCKSSLFVNSDSHHNPMFIAIILGNIEAVRLLIMHGWTPELEGKEMCMTSIEQAANCGQLQILKLLLEGDVKEEQRQAGDNEIEEWRGTGLWAKLLLAPTEDSVCSRQRPRYNFLVARHRLLEAACRSGEMPIIQYLLQTVGLDITKLGPLLAVAATQLDVFQFLFERSPPELRSLTPSDVAVILVNAVSCRPCLPVVKYLNNTVGITNLEMTAQSAILDILIKTFEITRNDSTLNDSIFPDTIDYLLDFASFKLASVFGNSCSLDVNRRRLEFILPRSERFDVNARIGKRGRTLLHILIKVDSHGSLVNFIRTLLERGADPSAKDSLGVAPLHLTNSAVIVRLLCDHGADLDAKDNAGSSILGFMPDQISDIRKRVTGVKAKVLEGGYPLVMSRENPSRATAALLFAHHGSLGLYRALLGLSASMSVLPHPAERDCQNRTALHYFCLGRPDLEDDAYAELEGDNSLIHWLIDSKRCRPTDVDDLGQTALHLTCMDSLELLTLGNNGWSPNIKDKDGLTPLHYQILEKETLHAPGLKLFSGLPKAIQNMCFGNPRINWFSTRGEMTKIFASFSTDMNRKGKANYYPIPLEVGLSDVKGRTIAHLLAELPADFEPIWIILALMDIRERFSAAKAKAVRKKARCEVTTARNTLSKPNAKSIVKPYFTDIKDSEGRTPVDIALGHDIECEWPEKISKFFSTFEKFMKV